MFSQSEGCVNSSEGSGGAPRERQKSSKPACTSPSPRRYASRNEAQSDESDAGSPEYGGVSDGSGSSSGLQETIRTHGRPLVKSAGKETTLSSTTTSGCS